SGAEGITSCESETITPGSSSAAISRTRRSWAESTKEKRKTTASESTSWSFMRRQARRTASSSSGTTTRPSKSTRTCPPQRRAGGPGEGGVGRVRGRRRGLVEDQLARRREHEVRERPADVDADPIGHGRGGYTETSTSDKSRPGYSPRTFTTTRFFRRPSNSA